MPQLSVHDRAVATGIRLGRPSCRASRTPAPAAQPAPAARVGKPLPQDQATAALSERLELGNVADDVQEEQHDDQEQECIITPKA